MRILFIQPRRNEGMGFRDLFQIEPLGMELIAGSLKEENLKIIDLMPLKKILKEAFSFKPDLCGISCSFTVDVDYTLQLAGELKKILPNTFIFVGGHHAAINSEDFHSPSIDAVVCGEGEGTVEKMVEVFKSGSELYEVEGLVLNQEDEQHHTGTRHLRKDLDQLPDPARHLVEPYRKHYYHGFRRPIYALETTRGCPYRCKFCSVWKYYKGRHRMKSAARVVEDIARIPGEYIFMTDDNFLTSIPRAEKIGEELLRRGIKKEFVIQVRSDDLVNNPDLVDLWHRAGLRSTLIGFEQIDQEGLDKLNKKNSVINNEKALKMLQDKGISVMASFIVDPQCDYSDFQRLIDYVRRWNIKIPSYTVLTPLPGTVLYEEMKDRLITSEYHLFDFLHAVIPTRLPLKEFYRELARLWAQTYNMGNLTRNGLSYYARLLVAQPSNLIQIIRFYRGIRRLFNEKAYIIEQGYGK
ncbi:MAG: radical SAM protein [Bacillota bacterium]